MIRWSAFVLLMFALVSCAGGEQTLITGVVVDYQGDLVTVQSFTVQTPQGERLQFVPAADADFGFPLPHLKEHMVSSEAVEVRYVDEGDRLIATSVSDARF